MALRKSSLKNVVGSLRNWFCFRMRRMALLKFRERREWATTIARLLMNLKISHALRANLCVKSYVLSFTSAYLSLFLFCFLSSLLNIRHIYFLLVIKQTLFATTKTIIIIIIIL